MISKHLRFYNFTSTVSRIWQPHWSSIVLDPPTPKLWSLTSHLCWHCVCVTLWCNVFLWDRMAVTTHGLFPISFPWLLEIELLDIPLLSHLLFSAYCLFFLPDNTFSQYPTLTTKQSNCSVTGNYHNNHLISEG